MDTPEAHPLGGARWQDQAHSWVTALSSVGHWPQPTEVPLHRDHCPWLGWEFPLRETNDLMFERERAKINTRHGGWGRVEGKIGEAVAL